MAGRSFVMMSGEAPRFAHKKTGHEDLKSELTSHGLNFEETQGMYDKPERSVIVHDMPLHLARHMAKRFGQESFIFGDGVSKPALVYANGDHADHFHPGKSVNITETPPDNHYTVMNHPTTPGQKVYMQVNLDWDQLKPTRQLGAAAHPNSYPWHDDKLSEEPETVGLRKAENDQAAGAGVKTFAQTVEPWGRVTPGVQTNLRHYDYRPFEKDIDAAAEKAGYKFKTMGGKAGIPDLKADNYNHGTLHIWDPSAGSGGDFGEEAYTRSWRKAHELAHASTYADINAKYGEGRRIGKLGHHRTPDEAKRATEWEYLVAHKQREQAAQMGHHISDHDFHRELNTIMADAVHRAIHGTFTEPSQEGFTPHPHPVPLETAHAMIDAHAAAMGLGPKDTLKSKKAPLAPPAPAANPTPDLKEQLAG